MTRIKKKRVRGEETRKDNMLLQRIIVIFFPVDSILNNLPGNIVQTNHDSQDLW